MNLNRRSFLAGIFTLPVLNKLVPKKPKLFNWTKDKMIFRFHEKQWEFYHRTQDMVVPFQRELTYFYNPGIKCILTDIEPPEGY